MAARARGLRVILEAFAEHRYEPDGSHIAIPFDTICIHADMEHAVERLRAIRADFNARHV